MNEVEIVVTAKDRASGVVGTTTRQFKGLRGELVNVGDQISKLDGKIEASSEKVRQLGVEFERTGSKDVFKQLREERGALANLRTMRGELANFAKSAGDEGGKAGSSFRNRFGGAILKGGSTFFGNIAESATTLLSRQFGTAVSRNPIIGAGLAAGIGAVLLGAMPAIGSAAAGALVLGFGGGLAGMGIAAAAQNERVAQSFSRLVSYVGGMAKRISTPFVPVLLEISRMARTTFDGFVPHLQAAFARMAPHVQGFAGNMFEAFSHLKTAIGPITTAFNALLDSIGPTLPGLFEQLSGAITNVANSISSNPQTFTNLVTWTFQLATGLTNLIAKLSSAANWFQEHSNVTKGLFAVLTTGLGPLAALGLGIGKNTEASQKMANAHRDTNTALQDQAETAQWLAQQIDVLNSKAMSAEQANLRYEESVDKITESIRKNGNTLSINTEKGRANRQALMSGAQAAIAARDAQLQQGVALNTANLRLAQQRERLINTAVSAGMSRRAAQQYVDSLLRVPPGVVTNFRNNASSAKAEVAGLSRVIKTLPNGKTFVFTVATRITGPAAARRAFNTGGSGGFQFEASGGIIGGRGSMSRAASGGPRSALTLVGEQGPELLRLPVGSMVKSNADSRRLASRGGGPGMVVLQLNNHGVLGSRNDVLNWLVGALDDLRHQRRLTGLTG